MVILPEHGPKHIGSPDCCQPLAARPSCLSSGFQHTRGRPKGPIWMWFKIHSSASFPVSQLHSPACRPSSPVPVPYSTAALHAYVSCFPLIAFCTFSLCPHSLAFAGSVFIASWQMRALGHTFNYLWTISIYSSVAFLPFSFTEHCLHFLSLSACSAACCCSLSFFFFFFFFSSVFSLISLSSLTELYWPCPHYCPFCTFALRRAQAYPQCVKCSLHLIGNQWYRQSGVSPPKCLSFWCTVISASLVVSLLSVFPFKLDLTLYFYTGEVHCGDNKGHSCLPCRWRCAADQVLLKYVIFPVSCALRHCCPLLLLPPLWLAKHISVWTNSSITSLMFL